MIEWYFILRGRLLIGGDSSCEVVLTFERQFIQGGRLLIGHKHDVFKTQLVGAEGKLDCKLTRYYFLT